MLPVGMTSVGSVSHQTPQSLERSSDKGDLAASDSILGLSSSAPLTTAHFHD